jgi:transposase-like protein
MTASKADTEVVAKASRRRFSPSEKLRILREAEGCTLPGELGSLLRREGLYSSQLGVWRRARERGELDGLSPGSRGPKSRKPDLRDKKIAELERENRRLRAKLERAEGLIEVQKKVSEILGIRLDQDGKD